MALSWNRSKDNTITAYYRVRADGKTLAETHQLSLSLDPAAVAGRALTVTAWDLYGNESKPSAPVRVR